MIGLNGRVPSGDAPAVLNWRGTAMSMLLERIENKVLLSRVLPVEEAVKYVTDRCTLATSGFMRAGEPKTFLPALADHLARKAPDTRITLLSGASLSQDVEDPLAPFIARRGPYMASPASRRLIHAGQMAFTDVHFSQFARNIMAGFYGEVDLAVVEVSRICADGSVVLGSSVGIAAEALHRARKVVLEVNTAIPDYSGFHDVVLPPVYPQPGWPLPITGVGDRIGTPCVRFDTSKVVAVVESHVPDHPVPFKETSQTDRRIAEHVVSFLLHCRDWLGWGSRMPPIQSGVGHLANAIVKELYRSPFQRMRFWTEAFQDGMLRYLESEEKFECATATGLSLSAPAQDELLRLFSRCRDRLVLRPMWVTNSPEVISRLFVVSLNTPVEVDIYGHVNSSHVEGSRVIHGLGGSGDFMRNAYVSVVHTPSTRHLKDGRTVSCILPVVRHIDHTEHDIKCVVTEQGYAVNMDIRSPRHRAEEVIEKCAHPHFRPLLKSYLKLAGRGDEPNVVDVVTLDGWWKDYDAACRSFPD
jgi:acetyl-CoA hydrolase